MVKYYFTGETFVIEDYQNAKTFSSFFPAVSGVDGKPMWTFYCSRGQAISSFGVNSKSTPIIPFDSATLAYQNINLKAFRTFLKINGKYFEPFASLDNHKTKMAIDKAKLTIETIEKNVRVTISYSNVPHRPYSGLIRKVTIENLADHQSEFEMIDGLPIFFPHGLSNVDYKELVSLMAAYCEVHDLEKRMPFVKFKTSTADCSEVKEVKSGNAFLSVNQDGEKLLNIVDGSVVFGNDLSLIEARNFKKGSLSFDKQQTENKLPSAFSYAKFKLKAHEKYQFASIYGKFDDQISFHDELEHITIQKIEAMIDESQNLVEELLSPIEVSSNIPLFDMYAKQSLLDNNLRGGFPIEISKGVPYYVYSRKHGDMERDYNFFKIADKYYSSGEGNFRDVNQNRRSDIYFYPFVKDYNIKMFFDLIQLDGQNPLNVRPPRFEIKKGYDLSKYHDQTLETLVSKAYEPSSLYAYLKDQKKDAEYEKHFEELIANSSLMIEANFGEGYWIDHWTYNVDLLYNYVSVYPDHVEELLFRDDYQYFYSPVMVEPRDEKYCLLPDGRIRQYGAIDLKKLKKECEERHLDLKNTDWLKDKKGQIYQTTLISKIINLALVKFSTLDSRQLGIEMECEKPGWNDAMNGLPGLFASSVGESIELLRLIEFFLEYSGSFKDREISLLNEQYSLYCDIDRLTKALRRHELSSFDYWDLVTASREKLRAVTHIDVTGKVRKLKVKKVILLFKRLREILIEGIKESKKLNHGIIPSYLVYEVQDYEKLDKINHNGYPSIKVKSFNLKMIPLFLEASARSFKVGKEITSRADYKAIKKTELYDPVIKMYKTCASLDEAPFEIGRVHAFTKGWLERECVFLHMTYKYLLGLLKGGYYREFYHEIKSNFVYNLDPYIYGRSPLESSSFIVPTCNPDDKLYGQGFFARLTGANAEFLDMFNTMIFGKNLFVVKDQQLKLNLNPLLEKKFFKKDGTFSFKLLNKVKVTYINPKNINAYEKTKLTYIIDNQKYDEVVGPLAEKIRDGKIDKLNVVIE